MEASPNADLVGVLVNFPSIRSAMMASIIDLLDPFPCWGGVVITEDHAARFAKRYDQICRSFAEEARRTPNVFDVLAEGPWSTLDVLLLAYLPPRTVNHPLFQKVERAEEILDIRQTRNRCFKKILESGDPTGAYYVFNHLGPDPKPLEESILPWLKLIERPRLDEGGIGLLNLATGAYASIERPEPCDEALALLIQVATPPAFKSSGLWLGRAAYVALARMRTRKAMDFLLTQVFAGAFPGWDNDDPTIESLLAALDQSDRDLASAIYQSFSGSRANHRIGALVLEKLGLVDLIEKDAAGEDAARALWALEFGRYLKPERAGPLLLQTLRDPRRSADFKLTVAYLCDQARHEDLDAFLIEQIRSGTGLLSPALDAVTIKKVQTAVPAIIEISKTDSSPEFTERLVRALGALADPQSLPFLIDMSSHGQPAVRQQAISALASVGDPRGFDAAVRGLEDPDIETRKTALRHIGGFRDPRAITALAPFLSSPNRHWQEPAVSALAEIGGPEAIEALRKAFPHLHPVSRAMAEEFLKRNGRR
jgi:HEAT repeat protein